MPRDYTPILEDYDLPAMLWRLNDACGADHPLELAERQEIRQLVERLHQEQTRPIKLANVHRITLFFDGQVEILRRGSDHCGAQRLYRPSRALYNAIAHLCHTHAKIIAYAYHRGSTVYRVCEYVPQS